MVMNPNFNEHIKKMMLQDTFETNTPRPGIIQSYDPMTNTATVMMLGPNSAISNQILTDVICPVYMGVVLAAPGTGRPCWVAFQGNRNDNRAIVVSYFNHNYQTFDFDKQSTSRSGVPRFMLGM